MSDFNTLKDDISKMMATGGLPTELFISMAESEANRRLRIQAMEVMTEETPATQALNDLWVIPFPADFLQLRHIERAGVRLEYVSNNHMALDRAHNNNPDIYTISDESFQFTSADATVILYHKQFPRLSDTNLTNWLIDNAYDALLYLSLHHAGVYMKEANDYRAQGRMILEEIQTMDDMARQSGAPLVQRG